MLRRRKRALETVKQLDAFSRTDETYVETSTVGGIVTVLSFILIGWLMHSEIKYYRDSQFVFNFSPDTDFDAKLKINIDITVAMPCARVGADILDSTNQNAYAFGSLEEENTWFELTAEQRRHFDSMYHINSYLREEFHAVQELLWKQGQSAQFGDLPKRTVEPNRPHDACRIYGSLELNKVTGNFHITAGKSISLPRGHIHISAFMTENDYNFTHRINKLSFGDPSPGILHPLEGDEKVTRENMMLYQYFIEVVPTTVNTFMKKIQTYQYSVKEHTRPIDHDKGSHGLPGIFIKYDVSSLKVDVRQERDNIVTFCIRLFATIGGIIVLTGILNSFIQILLKIVMTDNQSSKEVDKFKQRVSLITDEPDSSTFDKQCNKINLIK